MENNMQVNSISFKSLPFNLGMKPAVQANSQEMVEILKEKATASSVR